MRQDRFAGLIWDFDHHGGRYAAHYVEGAALEWLVERVEPLAGGPVRLERSDASRPPATVELAVFRVAQEAITNAIKHGRPPIAVR